MRSPLDNTLIIEVLSPSTAAYDRGLKFSHYRSLPSLQEYVLIDLDTRSTDGYRKGADGWRTLPNGRPLVLRLATGTSQIERTFNELWKKSMDAISVRIEFDAGKFSDHLKQAKACQLMMWGAAWTADYPDGENFMQLLYGPNTGQSNNGCYESKSFDALYERARAMSPDRPERNRLFLEMTRQMEVDGAWSMHVSRERNQMIRPWVLGYKKHPILHAEWIYMDLEPRN